MRQNQAIEKFKEAIEIMLDVGYTFDIIEEIFCGMRLDEELRDFGD